MFGCCMISLQSCRIALLEVVVGGNLKGILVVLSKRIMILLMTMPFMLQALRPFSFLKMRPFDCSDNAALLSQRPPASKQEASAMAFLKMLMALVIGCH